MNEAERIWLKRIERVGRHLTALEMLYRQIQWDQFTVEQSELLQELFLEMWE
jgi:hypothetical protein